VIELTDYTEIVVGDSHRKIPDFLIKGVQFITNKSPAIGLGADLFFARRHGETNTKMQPEA
jgi:hypothetical protein